jgi:hypothetical protein
MKDEEKERRAPREDRISEAATLLLALNGGAIVR